MRDEATQSGGKTVVAKVSKVPDKLKPYIPDELDILITISEDQWIRAEAEQRKAIIDHELCHIINKDVGWGIRAHDVEEFAVIIDRYGLWNGDLWSASVVLKKATQMVFPSVDFKAGGNVVALKPEKVNVEVKKFGI